MQTYLNKKKHDAVVAIVLDFYVNCITIHDDFYVETELVSIS